MGLISPPDVVERNSLKSRLVMNATELLAIGASLEQKSYSAFEGLNESLYHGSSFIGVGAYAL